MPRGRPRKSTQQHLAEGTYRPDRHGRGVGRSDTPSHGRARKPRTLSKAAGALWDTRVKELIEAGVIESSDTESAELLCETWAGLREIVKGLRRDPTDKELLAAYRVLVGVWKDLAARFGLTPADRQRVPRRPAGDEDEEFFGT